MALVNKKEVVAQIIKVALDNLSKLENGEIDIASIDNNFVGGVHGIRHNITLTNNFKMSWEELK